MDILNILGLKKIDKQNNIMNLTLEQISNICRRYYKKRCSCPNNVKVLCNLLIPDEDDIYKASLGYRIEKAREYYEKQETHIISNS